MLLSAAGLVGAVVLDSGGGERAAWEGAARAGVMTLCTEEGGRFQVEARVAEGMTAVAPSILLFASEPL